MKQARDAHGDEDPTFTFQIAFGDAEIMKGEPFIPPLHQLANVIDAIIMSFDPLLS